MLTSYSKREARKPAPFATVSEARALAVVPWSQLPDKLFVPSSDLFLGWEGSLLLFQTLVVCSPLFVYLDTTPKMNHMKPFEEISQQLPKANTLRPLSSITDHSH